MNERRQLVGSIPQTVLYRVVRIKYEKESCTRLLLCYIQPMMVAGPCLLSTGIDLNKQSTFALLTRPD